VRFRVARRGATSERIFPDVEGSDVCDDDSGEAW
jgi:hypothetical protein